MTAIPPHHFKSRVSQSLSQITIVGHQQQSRRVLVQTTHSEQSLVRDGNQVDRPRSPVRVTICTEDSARLVQQKVAESRHPQSLGIQPHITGLGMHRAGRIRDDLAVHHDATIPNVLLTVPPRINTGHREKLLQPHHGGIFTGLGLGCVRSGCRSRRCHTAGFRDSHRSWSGRSIRSSARTRGRLTSTRRRCGSSPAANRFESAVLFFHFRFSFFPDWFRRRPD